MAGQVTAAATIVTSQVVLTGFGILFGGGLLGLAIGKILPKAHLGEGTLPMVQAAMGTLSILSALVLGFLINSAKAKFENVSVQIEQFASDLAILDRELRNFGQDAVNARDCLRRYAAAKIAATWPEVPGQPTFDDPTSLRLLDQFQAALRGLTPKTEEERLSLADANSAADDVVKITWRQIALGANTFSHPFLLIVQIWLGILFFSWGLFAPRNPIVIGAMFLCAATIAITVMITEDLDKPFGGIVSVSSRPIEDAVNRMSAP
jgi:hypothetical protein